MAAGLNWQVDVYGNPQDYQHYTTNTASTWTSSSSSTAVPISMNSAPITTPPKPTLREWLDGELANVLDAVPA